MPLITHMTPIEKLKNAARRICFCRRVGPAHEINFALADLDWALAEMGFDPRRARREDVVEYWRYDSPGGNDPFSEIAEAAKEKNDARR